MGSKSSIEWTQATWTVVQGCTEVSPECANCYARRELIRQAGNPNPKISAPTRDLVVNTGHGLRFTGKVSLRYDRLDWPVRWAKPRMIFVPSLGDLFHEHVPDDFIADVYATMARAGWHTFQNLTKRPERRAALLNDPAFRRVVAGKVLTQMHHSRGDTWAVIDPRTAEGWPLPNVWEGTTAGNQRLLDLRSAHLAATPAKVRFLSLEPWLDFKPVDMQPAFGALNPEYPALPIHWVIMGGESRGPDYRSMVMPCSCNPDYRDSCSFCNGTGWQPRPTGLEAVRSVRDQCVEYGVPFFFKQWGGKTPKTGGRLLDGREWSEMPLRSEGALA